MSELNDILSQLHDAQASAQSAESNADDASSTAEECRDSINRAVDYANNSSGYANDAAEHIDSVINAIQCYIDAKNEAEEDTEKEEQATKSFIDVLEYLDAKLDTIKSTVASANNLVSNARRLSGSTAFLPTGLHQASSGVWLSASLGGLRVLIYVGVFSQHILSPPRPSDPEQHA